MDPGFFAFLQQVQLDEKEQFDAQEAQKRRNNTDVDSIVAKAGVAKKPSPTAVGSGFNVSIKGGSAAEVGAAPASIVVLDGSSDDHDAAAPHYEQVALVLAVLDRDAHACEEGE